MQSHSASNASFARSATDRAIDYSEPIPLNWQKTQNFCLKLARCKEYFLWHIEHLLERKMFFRGEHTHSRGMYRGNAHFSTSYISMHVSRGTFGSKYIAKTSVFTPSRDPDSQIWLGNEYFKLLRVELHTFVVREFSEPDNKVIMTHSHFSSLHKWPAFIILDENNHTAANFLIFGRK